MSVKNVHIIINPIAGASFTAKLIPALKKVMSVKFGNSYSMHVTEQSNHATSLARGHVRKGAGLIIAVGGDGTIQEVINGFFKERKAINPDCELGIVSVGTGKGFAQTLNLPTSIYEQVDLLGKPGHIEVDVGCVSYQDVEGKTKERLFISECQIGIGAEVVSRVGIHHKKLGGKAGFGIAALCQLLKNNSCRYSLKYSEIRSSDLDLTGIVIGNGSYCGGGMRLTPDAKPDDGYFDVLLIHQMRLINRITSFSKVYSGKHINSTHFSVFRDDKIEVDTDDRIPLEADGELLGFTPCRVEMLKEKIKVKCNPN